MRASIITPVWNKALITMAFLKANHILYGRKKHIEMVVVDNGSTDRTPGHLVQWQDTWGSNLKVITLPENTGFGPGNNKGAKVATGEILVFLSNDVRILGDYIDIILDQLDPLALAGTQFFRENTAWNSFDGQIITYIAGWCTICTRQVWEKLGGYDPRFVPCDYEDMDLCLTAVQQGVRLQEIRLPLHHQFGQSAAQLPGGRLGVTLANQQRFKEKWGFKVLDKLY